MRAGATFGLAALALALGCAGEWAAVRDADTPAAYRRFLTEHPGSSHAAVARERLAWLQILAEPTLPALERHLAAHPESRYRPETAKLLDSLSFQAARDAGTAPAYEDYLARFPDGAHAAEARASAQYLHEDEFAGRPEALAEFAARHPGSGEAAEARRTLRALEASGGSRLEHVGLRVVVETPPGDAERLARIFTERAQRAWSAAGIQLVPAPDAASEAGLDALLEIHHAERRVESRVENGRVAPPGVLAETTAALRTSEPREVIASETFSFHASEHERDAGGSVLFGPRAALYWSRFYVPVASWPTQVAVRPPLALGEGVSGVAAPIGRAVVVFGDGSLDEIDLSDPGDPRIVAHYAHAPGLSRFSGVRPAGDRAVLYGPDGLELVDLDRAAQRARPRLALDRGQVGALAGVEIAAGGLLVAGSQGLLRVPLDGGPPEQLLDRPLRGLGRAGDGLLLLTDAALLALSPGDLRAEPQVVSSLPRGFAPRLLRVGGDLAVVIGVRGVQVFDVGQPRAPRVLTALEMDEVGAVADAAVLGESVFLVGDRGLLALDPRRGAVVDAIDVEGRQAIGAAGRHLVVAGPDRVQVVDATPWLRGGSPASLSDR
jgi:hypothetical protein